MRLDKVVEKFNDLPKPSDPRLKNKVFYVKSIGQYYRCRNERWNTFVPTESQIKAREDKKNKRMLRRMYKDEINSYADGDFRSETNRLIDNERKARFIAWSMGLINFVLVIWHIMRYL